MNAAVDGLEPKFRGLGLHAMRVAYRACLINAEKENWGYLRLVERLVDIEASARVERKIERLLGDSRLPAEFTLATLNPQKLNEKPRRMLPSLLTGDFVQRGDNILCFGLPGRGKSLYCAAIARELVRQQQIRALFVPSFKLVSDLLLAKATHTLPKALEQLARYALIVVDDIGYVQHSAEEMEVLFTFLAERYQQQKSLMVTSNLVFSAWDRIFKDPMTAMAAVDRLIHRGVILEFVNDESMREEESRRRNT